MILVLGSTGFLGKHVCEKLSKRGLSFEASSLCRGVNLENLDEVRRLFDKVRPEKVINCAAYVGGISYGYKHPVDIFEKNLKMILNVLRVSHEFQLKRLVNPISNCTYPSKSRLFKEEDFWNGPMHESVLVYGFVRKALCVGSWAYQKELNLDVVNLVLSNMYGPDDHFDEYRSHAFGALIKKFCFAKEKNLSTVNVWGSGAPVREWLHVDDGAESLIRALGCKSVIDPVNVGVGKGISISELSKLISEAVGYKGQIIFDTSKPDGAPYKTVDGTKGKELLNWGPEKDILEGVRETVEWYKNNKLG